MDNYDMMALCPQIEKKFRSLAENCMSLGSIDPNLYVEYDVKRGLRDSNGRGVLTGLTEISDVTGIKVEDGVIVPAEGRLYYQGYDVRKLVGTDLDKRYNFEEITYLLLFGNLPTQDELNDFIDVLANFRELSGRFTRDVVMKAPSQNIMNSLMKTVLSLYSYDENPDDISVMNVLRQSLQLIAKVPLIAVYSYNSYRHLKLYESLFIKSPIKEMSTAENILQILRPDGKFTKLEARVLDAALVIHAEHGGGNNSTFTNHVVTSSGTDTYSAVAASIASLKGPRHGGANLKVQDMFEDLKKNVRDTENKDELRKYLTDILDKKAFDHSGLIYGMGHAVYTLSDPREVILKRCAEALSKEKGFEDEFRLHDNVEQISKELLMERRKNDKPVCANVDFYSGMVYTMLGIPKELFTPMFAIARMSGWSAHRLEELVNHGKIIRPAYKYVGKHREYVDINDR